jgi:hypothetical protein
MRVEDPMVARLPSGTRFVRIFLDEFGVLAFNPTPAAADRRAGSRYDYQESQPDPFATCYLAHPDRQTHVAFWEVFQNSVHADPTTGERFIFRSKLRGRSWGFVTAQVDLVLTDVRTMDGAARFGAKFKALQSSNRLRTRSWARLFRRHAPAHHGLLYTSAGYGIGENVVLFDPHCSPGCLTEFAPPEPLLKGPGLLRVKAALRPSRVRLTRG